MLFHKVVSKYGYNKGVGKYLCPFHKEKTPSMVFYENSFYCYGCGMGSNAIDWVINYENLINGREVSFKEVLEAMSSEFGKTKEEILSEVKNTNSESSSTASEEIVPAMDIEKVRDFIKEIGYADKPYRNIRPEISKFFGHLTKRDKDGNVLARYYPETNTLGQVTGYKCRNHPKDFSHGKIGYTGGKSQLAGQVKYKGGGKFVLIVGGEEDMAAAYQMFTDNTQSGYNVIPVVSPTTGETSAKNQILRQYDWLNKYETIIIGMDNDDAGREAALEIASILPQEKVKIAEWSGKDPNKMLQDGKGKQFVQDFWKAKDFIQTSVTSSSEAIGGIRDFLLAPKIKFPPHLHRLNEATRGGVRSTGAIVNIIASTSVGKTLLTDGLLYYWIFNSPIIPTIVSIERTKEELLIDLLSIHLSKNLTWFQSGEDAVEYLDRPEVQDLLDNLAYTDEGKPRFFVIDERDGSCENLQREVERSNKRNGSNLFLFDPLTDITRVLPNDEQDKFFMWQKQQKKNGLVLINVLHTRKLPPNKDGVIPKVGEYDALGSSTVVQSADISLVLNRDKMSTDSVVKNTTEIDMPKCRGGVTGKVCELYYDVETRRQYDKEDYFRELAEKKSASFIEAIT